MKKISGLKCRECGRKYQAKAIYVCEFCFGPLEVDYNYEQIKAHISQGKIKTGPNSEWRYWDLLPVETKSVISLGEGFTPLLPARNLGKLLGLEKLYIKNDAVNPTYSFKDRVVSVAITRAVELGFDTIACASTGNLACSVAAYGAYAGIKAFVFIPIDLEKGKIIGAGIYQPNLIGVEGDYDQVNRLCSEIADSFPWAFVNINIRPYYAEGSKTLGFEVAEQLGWKAPDHVVIPLASGCLLTKIYKGLKEFDMLGLIGKVRTKFSGAQPEGCSPIVTAYKENSEIVKPVKPNTIAKSLAIGNPADGYYAWKIMKESGGFAETVNDEEIIEGIKLLAETEGIFTETAGGVTVGVLKKLAQTGRIKKDELTVVFITGNGLKTQEAVSEAVSRPKKIVPTLKAFKEEFPRIKK